MYVRHQIDEGTVSEAEEDSEDELEEEQTLNVD
jgi:hypothetical protein